MEQQHYYAYNKTRESFLSLGVSIVGKAGGSFWSALPRRALKTNEGIWVSSVKGMREAARCDPCDRIYMDTRLHVVDLAEGGAGRPADVDLEQFSSALLVPAHTIFSSQTQLGDQLLIGTIEEIGAKLEGIEPPADIPLSGAGKGRRQVMRGPMNWLTRIFAARDRRRADRHSSLPVMAFYWDGGIPAPHSVPDISRTGLFLKTADRWYPRTLLRVTLQKKSDNPELPEQTITLQCRVVRTGEDGVGMAYMLADMPDRDRDGLMDAGHLASRKDLDHFFDQLTADFQGSSESEYPFLPFPELAQQAESVQNSDPAMPPESAEVEVKGESQAG